MARPLLTTHTHPPTTDHPATRAGHPSLPSRTCRPALERCRDRIVGPVESAKIAEAIPLVNPASAGQPAKPFTPHGFVKNRG